MNAGQPISPAAAAHWVRVEEALDRLLDLSPGERAAHLARLAAEDTAFEAELRDLLARMAQSDGRLDHAPRVHIQPPANAPTGLPPDTRVGAYRLVELLGRGGMGEVYLAERVDGLYEQQVAIKLLRIDAVTQLARFESERRILARLEHPGIARLLDGGWVPDGRPYMVMERVRGERLDAWASRPEVTFAQRIALFIEICEAVQSAHQHLVIHRDLKPANVMVDDCGRARLLDFGIARLLDQDGDPASQEFALTPAWAAPEQLRGQPVTTTTDVHALGLLLCTLLTGRAPWESGPDGMADGLRQLMREGCPRPSLLATRHPSAPVPPARLRGDLDAIVERATAALPAQRYGSVRELIDDLGRWRRGEPVQARRSSRVERALRWVKHHRALAAALATVMVVSTSAASALAWEARQARQAAARAEATKNFLLRVFKASDARVASDHPRGSITAKALLDESAARIESDFQSQPELALELLGVVTEIYGYLNEDERFAHYQQARKALALAAFGPNHPAYLDGLLVDAWDDIDRQDYTAAQKVLAHADRLLHEAGRDTTAQRAQWWLVHGESLRADARRQAERRQDHARAAALYARVAPDNPDRFVALANMASVDYRLGAYADAREGGLQALELARHLPDVSAPDRAVTLRNLAKAQAALGELAEAEQHLDQATLLSRQSTGEHAAGHWVLESIHAHWQCQRGEAQAALARFARIWPLVPADGIHTTDAAMAKALEADCQRLSGRADLALPVLQQAVAEIDRKPQNSNDQRSTHAMLAAALAELGRGAEARAALQPAVAEVMALPTQDGPGDRTIMVQWAALTLGDAGATAGQRARALALLQAQAKSPPISNSDGVATVQALAALASQALAAQDPTQALAQLKQAEARLAQVHGMHDVRAASELWREEARALMALNQPAEAQARAEAALQASLRTDDPASPAVVEARQLLATALRPVPH